MAKSGWRGRPGSQGRKKGVPQPGRMMAKARAAMRALPPEQREDLHWNGIGPGDSYVGMWKLIEFYRLRTVRRNARGIGAIHPRPATRR